MYMVNIIRERRVIIYVFNVIGGAAVLLEGPSIGEPLATPAEFTKDETVSSNPPWIQISKHFFVLNGVFMAACHNMF